MWSRPNGLRSFWKSWPWRGSGSEIPCSPKGNHRITAEGWRGTTNGDPFKGDRMGYCLQDGRPPFFFLATESFTLIGKLQKLERIACLERFQPFTFLFAVKVAQHGKCELFALGSVTQGRWCVSRRWWPCVNSACISSVGRKLGGSWSDLRSIFSRLGWWTNHQLDVVLPTLGD